MVTKKKAKKQSAKGPHELSGRGSDLALAKSYADYEQWMYAISQRADPEWWIDRCGVEVPSHLREHCGLSWGHVGFHAGFVAAWPPSSSDRPGTYRPERL